MRPEALIGLLAEEVRLRVFAAVVLGAATPEAVAEQSRLPVRQVQAALRRLARGGLLTVAGETLVARTELFKETVREHAPRPEPAEALDPDRSRAAVLRNFIVDGRLASIPASRGKRQVVLEHLIAIFEPGVKYPEKEVNALLRAWHPDYASLRRYLIDEGLMERDDGVYWRTGGQYIP